MARWSELLNMKIDTLDQLTSIADNITIRQLHGIPMPKGLTKKDIQEMQYWESIIPAEQYRSPKIGKLTGTEILQSIQKYFKGVISKKSKLKLGYCWRIQ